MSAKKLRVLCTVHGASGRRGVAACSLSQLARTAFRKRDARNAETLVCITAVDDDDPEHAAVCAEERDEKHWREVWRELKRQIAKRRAVLAGRA